MTIFNTKLRSMVMAFCLSLSVLSLTSSSAFAAATPWMGDANAAARIITAVEATGSTGQIDAALQIRLAPGWHAYWRSPGDAGFPPSIDWSGSQNFKSAQLFWPAPKRYILDGLITQGYEKGVVLPIAVVLDQAGTQTHLQASVHYAACKDICVPYTAKFTLPLPAGVAFPGAQAPLIAAAWKTIPVASDEVKLGISSVVISNVKNPSPGSVISIVLDTESNPLSHPDMFIERLPGFTAGAPILSVEPGIHRAVLSVFLKNHSVASIAGTSLQFTLEGGVQPTTFTAAPALGTLPTQTRDQSIIGIVLIAILGGLILNVMPCVLPVLSLKLFGLISAAGMQKRQFRYNLLATAAGVLVSFLVIAALLIFLKLAGAAIGWGIQFQQPWFLGAMAMLTTLFATSLWGWASISPPGIARHAAGVGLNRHPLIAAFLAGAFATILATSCSAPFVGTAVGFALARDPVTILEIFLSLGFGMALPYLIVASAPGLVSFLPKPGAWMIKLRIVLGFALLGTTIWLVTVIASVVSVFAAVISSMALLVFLAVLYARHRTAMLWLRRGILSGFALILAITGIITPEIMQQTAALATPKDLASASVFQPFDQSRINGLIAQNKLIFVDVTAAWCLVCKVNALTVLNRDPVVTQLNAKDVVAMRADWTRPSPLITAYLESFHRYGVPLDVVYGPGAPSGILLPTLLTTSVVIDAFHRAAVPLNIANQSEAIK